MITYAELHNLFEYKDGFLFRKKSAGNRKANDKVGSYNDEGYLQTKINKKYYKVHRLIFLMHYGYLPELVDHINGIKNDNKIENLRPATKYENRLNSTKKIINKSGYKNVSWNKAKNKWVVSIEAKGKLQYRGFFDDIELADLVAQEARDKFHGKFARHN